MWLGIGLSLKSLVYENRERPVREMGDSSAGPGRSDLGMMQIPINYYESDETRANNLSLIN